MVVRLGCAGCDCGVPRTQGVVGPERACHRNRRGPQHGHPREQEEPPGDLGAAAGRLARFSGQEHRRAPVNHLTLAAIPEMDQQRNHQPEQAPEQ